MSRWPSPSALARGAVLLAVVAAVSGCGDAGRLRDAGPARTVAVRPSSEPLWPASEHTATATPKASGSLPPLTPVPGITVAGDDIRTVEAAAVLARDPSLRQEERKALAGCQDCQVRPAQYRDLSGDGKPELITAALFGSGSGYLHVYALKDGQLYSVLAQQVASGFTAETVGPELLVKDPDSGPGQTETAYGWHDDRLVTVRRKTTGPDAGGPYCEPTAEPSVRPERTEPKSSLAPSPVPTVPPAKQAPAAPTPVPVKPAA
ncbi:hypothetical protein AB0K51_13690 [Kitasatospora sp. NPDC049285]|uniref:hypothetical protein n=1 Tax=Kitasatospora sp. NPDC049285 TaxID=3157096 RepID=UPI0034149CE6